MVAVTIKPTAELKGEVCAPPSKSYTQRMLIASALSSGTSKISGPLFSDDTEATLRAVKALGAKVDAANSCWTVEGASLLNGAKEPVDCGESGATLRFMIPVAALAAEPSVFLLGKSLERRPIEPLLQSLAELGVETSVGKIDGRFFVKVDGGGILGGKTSIPGDVSSQFISGLMFACPKAQNDTEIAVTTPLESKGYVEMTREVLAKHGVEISIWSDYSMLNIPSCQTFTPADHKVPGDFSSTAFLLAAAAISRSRVVIMNLNYSLVQGDKAIVGVLKQMGVNGRVCRDSIEIEGTGNLLTAVDFSARDTPDLVPVCAALGCYAKGISTIHDAQRIKLKESDRLQSLYHELKKMGADAVVSEDSLAVKGPCNLHGADIDPHNDHRIAMACAVAALGAEGETVIHDAECVKKSYPTFFIDLQRLGVDVVGGKFDR
jgi:3-phosphoshikimate 1-carboxyvinyltransferase